jgi:hypothetical protein
MAADEPAHEVLLSDGNIEVRRYAPSIVAEVKVSATSRDPASSGFQPLADYIFGNNRPREKIAMTAPVARQRSGQTIDMTSPVARSPGTEGGDWTVQFFMPPEWTMETLPVPNNPDVTLRPVPARTLVAIRFSGSGGSGAQARHWELLQTWLVDKGYKAVGAPIFAGYDPPWTAPFLRRNEVMIEVEAAPSNAPD